MLNIKVVSWSLASTALISFVVCVVYGLVTPETLHIHAFLEQVLPGPSGTLSAWSQRCRCASAQTGLPAIDTFACTPHAMA